MSKEIWKDIVGYEDVYQVSNTGKVRSLDREVEYDCETRGRFVNMRKGRELSGGDVKGYLQVGLSSFEGVRNRFFIHRLVADAFIPNPENKPYINHKDNNSKNNDINNLEWCTHQENIDYKVAQDRQFKPKGESNGASKLTEEDVIEIRKLLKMKIYTQTELGEMFGVKREAISHIHRGRTWRHIA